LLTRPQQGGVLYSAAPALQDSLLSQGKSWGGVPVPFDRNVLSLKMARRVARQAAGVPLPQPTSPFHVLFKAQPGRIDGRHLDDPPQGVEGQQMQRTYSKMTAAELAAWRRQHGLTVRQAAGELGVPSAP